MPGQGALCQGALNPETLNPNPTLESSPPNWSRAARFEDKRASSSQHIMTLMLSERFMHVIGCTRQIPFKDLAQLPHHLLSSESGAAVPGELGTA